MSKLLKKDLLREDNSFQVSQVAKASQATLPIGFIAIYSGSWTDNSTMLGWYKCDGNNGTVNLVNRFVRGGATSGASGGSDDAVVVSHAHDFKWNEAGIGVTLPERQAVAAAGQNEDSGIVLSTGESGVGKNIPAYYTLIFIQRIS